MRDRRAWMVVVISVVAAAAAAQGGSTTYTYDANGNVTSKTENGVVWTYIYEARNLLREVQRDGLLIESYNYDHQGRRIKKAGSGSVVRYVWDDDKILLETDDTGNTIAKYEYASDRLLSVTHVTEGLAYYLFDGLGSPVSLIKPDGSLAARYSHDAWGSLRSQAGASSSPFLFTGHQFDKATGLYSARARYYDPEIGRFFTEDPAVGDPMMPTSMHEYAYANANPTIFTDPTGQYSEAGHYYTPYYVALRVGMSPAEARNFAFYSQVPDEVSSLDAVANQISAAFEKSRDAAWPGRGSEVARSRRSINQPSVHALTGTNASLESKRARQALAGAPTLAAAGVAAHRLGDTFSHRDLENSSSLYPTGPGHGWHGTAPDTIQARPALYLEYVRSLADALKQRCGDQCQGAPTDEIVEALKLATELPPGGEIPGRLDLEGHRNLAGFAEKQVRAMLQLESDWRVTEGEEALDLSFRPEEFDVPRVGDKTLPDLVREMEDRSQISSADKEWINERELEVAAGYANQRYQQEQTGIVAERADAPGVAVKPHRLEEKQH